MSEDDSREVEADEADGEDNSGVEDEEDPACWMVRKGEGASAAVPGVRCGATNIFSTAASAICSLCLAASASTCALCLAASASTRALAAAV